MKARFLLLTPYYQKEALKEGENCFMTQEFVGSWRPVSGYDLYGPVASCDRLNLAKHVEKRGVNGMNVTGAEIPEENGDFFLHSAGAAPRRV